MQFKNLTAAVQFLAQETGCKIRVALREPTEEEMTDPQKAYEYAWIVKGDRFPEGEQAIASNPTTAYGYALNVLGRRFNKGEDAIRRDRDLSYYYALTVLKGPFKAGEKAIDQDDEIKRLYEQFLSTKVNTEDTAEEPVMDREVLRYSRRD